MATFIQEKMPKVLPNDTEGSMRKLYKYVESLNEQLAYIFGNLGGDNFNTQDMNNFIANLGATNIVTQTIVSNSVVTKSLYAERGDIAQLTVDWLSTSQKVMKYLNKDTSDDDYIEAHEQGIELKSASVVMSGSTPVTEALFDRYGNQLYWQKDIAYAEIIDGFPYVNGKQVYMDTEVTDYPVEVYQYNVTTKMHISFGAVDGVNVPKIEMGDVVITDSDVTIGGVSVKEMFESGGGSGGSVPRIGEVTLAASSWVGEGNLHSQVVNIDGVTENSQVDLTPSIEQLVVFYEKDLAFLTENEGGVVTVYAIGQKPTSDYTVQVTVTEVIV